MLSIVKKEEKRKVDIIELLNQCTMKLAWGCAVSSSYLQPKHPSTYFSLFLSVYNSLQFYQANHFHARHDLENEPSEAECEQNCLVFNFHVASLKGTCLFCTFSCPFFLWARICIWVQRVRNEQMKMLIAFYRTLELKGRNKFWGLTHRLGIIHAHMTHLQMYSGIWSTYILRNRYPTLLNHCISRSHCFNSSTYLYLIHHVSARHLAL